MKTVYVWLHPLADGCDVRVLGIENAEWLLKRLTHIFVVNSGEVVNAEKCYPRCSFRMSYSSRIPRRRFERLLAAIPEVRLMLDLA